MADHTVPLGKSVHRSSFKAITHFFGALLFALAFAIGLITISAKVAQAETFTSSHYDYPIDFALTFSSSDIDLREGSTHYDVDMKRINVSAFALENSNFQLGFNAGYNYLSLDNDALLAGINLDGYHAGLALRGHYGKDPQLGFQADYRYQETRDDTETQSTTFNWNEWTMAVSGKVKLAQQLRLMLGVAYSEIDARRNTRGDIDDTLDMRLDSATQTQLELEWLIETGGRVSIALQSGAYQNLAFKFAQRF